MGTKTKRKSKMDKTTRHSIKLMEIINRILFNHNNQVNISKGLKNVYRNMNLNEVRGYVKGLRGQDIKYINKKINDSVGSNLPYWTNDKKKCLTGLIKFLERPRMVNNPHKKRGVGKNKSLRSKYNTHISNAMMRGIDNFLTFEDYCAIIKNPCYLCGTRDRLSVDREASDECYIKSNCLSCCGGCNKMKLDSTNQYLYSKVTIIKERFDNGLINY